MVEVRQGGKTHYLAIGFKTTKSDQFGLRLDDSGHDWHPIMSAPEGLDIIAVCRIYRELMGPQPPGAPFFQQIGGDGRPNGRPLLYKHMLADLRADMAGIGVPDPQAYTLHSTRRGGATALFRDGQPLALIQAAGRWSSEAVLTYTEISVAQLQQISSAIMRHQQLSDSGSDSED